jgi:hypothetical protein
MFANSQMQQSMKRNFVLDQLKERGITHSQTGTSIENLSYEELKYLLVLSAFQEIDVNNQESKWF